MIETPFKDWKNSWERKEELLISKGWKKIANSETICNTPVYQKDDNIMHLDCNIGYCSHFYIEGGKIQELKEENL